MGRGLLEAHAGRLLRHQGDSHLSLDEFKQQVASGNAPEREERIPTEQEREIILQMKAQHYARWPDDPLPALSGKTARQAVKTKSGRKAVLDLIRDMERDETTSKPRTANPHSISRRCAGPRPGIGLTRETATPATAISCHNFEVDVVLTGVQPDEIALNPADAGAVGDRRIAALVEALFREHYGRIVSMLTRLTGDRAHSEEIASDVFHKLSQRPALLESREDLTAWIYRVATNAGFDALRTNSRRRKREEAAGLEGIHAAAAPSALDAMLAEERRGRVRAVLGVTETARSPVAAAARKRPGVSGTGGHAGHRTGVAWGPCWRAQKRNLNGGFARVTEKMYDAMLVGRHAPGLSRSRAALGGDAAGGGASGRMHGL